MRIAFLGNFEVDYSSENHHKKSLESLGHEVVTFQEGKDSADTVIHNALNSSLFIWIHTHGWRTPSGIYSEKDILRILKENNIPTMSYHLDLWFGLHREKDLKRDPFYTEIDHFFATDKLMTDWFNENTNVKGHYIPAGVYDKEVYFKDLEKDHVNLVNDVIFVGSKGYHPEWPYRPKLINWLRTTYGEKFTHIGGDGDTGTIRGELLNMAYTNSKVAVGDTLCIDYKYPYYFSDRLFESIGRGGFTVFPYIKGLEDQFELEKEIVTYTYGDFEELKRVIDYYCEHDEEREEIRKAGLERVKKDHTYIQRWKQILKIIEEGK